MCQQTTRILNRNFKIALQVLKTQEIYQNLQIEVRMLKRPLKNTLNHLKEVSNEPREAENDRGEPKTTNRTSKRTARSFGTLESTILDLHWSPS